MEKQILAEIVPDDDEDESRVTAYPIASATEAELRRAWILELLCATPEGPIFETLVTLAADIEQFLISGARPKPRALK